MATRDGLRVPEVAALLGRSSYSIRKAIRNGAIPAVTVMGRILVSRKWLEQHHDFVKDVKEDRLADALQWGVKRQR